MSRIVSGHPVFSVGSVFWALTNQCALNDNIAVAECKFDAGLPDANALVPFKNDQGVFGFVRDNTVSTNKGRVV
jgi:hypothetical protein